MYLWVLLDLDRPDGSRRVWTFGSGRLDGSRRVWRFGPVRTVLLPTWCRLSTTLFHQTKGPDIKGNSLLVQSTIYFWYWEISETERIISVKKGEDHSKNLPNFIQLSSHSPRLDNNKRRLKICTLVVLSQGS